MKSHTRKNEIQDRFKNNNWYKQDQIKTKIGKKYHKYFLITLNNDFNYFLF